MKQLTLFLFLLTFIACSKDEETSFSATDLKGTWNLTSLTCTDGVSTTEVLGQKLTSTFVLSSKDHNATVLFGENPNTYVSKGSYTGIVTTTTAGVKETEETPFEDFSSTGTWKIEGNMLIVSSPGEPDQKAEITKLDAKNLEYKVLVNETIEDFGFKITVTGTYITKLTR
jgi:hypothetical protein